MSGVRIEKAGPSHAGKAASLIYQTDPGVWDYLFDANREACDRFVSGLWQLEANTYAHSEAVVLRDGDDEAICGLELGYAGASELALRERMEEAVGGFLPERELIALVERAVDIDYLTPHLPAQAYYLHFLSVDPACQGRGLGRVLLENCFRRAADLDCRWVHLDVFTDNPAVGLYRAFGFRIVVETRFPGKEGLPPHYRMVKDL